jgi:hypothetical protein
MVPQAPDNPNEGQLPEPDASETLRVMMHGSAGDGPFWRRLLSPGLVSLGLHVFFISLFVTVTVTFADAILVPLSTTESTPPRSESDYEMALLERDYSVEDVEEVPAPARKWEFITPVIEGGIQGQPIPVEVAPNPNDVPVVVEPPIPPLNEDSLVPLDPPADSAKERPFVLYPPPPPFVEDRAITLAKWKPGEIRFTTGRGDPGGLKNLSRVDIVGPIDILPPMIVELVPEFFKDMKPGSRIVSLDLAIKGVKPDYTENFGGYTIYLWKIPLQFEDAELLPPPKVVSRVFTR